MSSIAKRPFTGSDPTRRLQWLPIAAAVTGAVAVFLVLLMMWRAGIFLRGDVAFTSSLWKRIDPDRRHHLANDFLQNHFVAGMSVEELFELLGDPVWDHQFWHYWLSDNGAPPSDVMTGAEWKNYPSLAINLAGGRVRSGFESWSIDPPPQRNFDAGEWRSASPSDRFGMIVSLVESGILLDKDTGEVTQLLGPADQQDPQRTITYYVGWNLIDAILLRFEVDEQGRVVDGALRDG